MKTNNHSALTILTATALLFLGLQNYQHLTLNWRLILPALETNSLFVIILASSLYRTKLK